MNLQNTQKHHFRLTLGGALLLLMALAGLLPAAALAQDPSNTPRQNLWITNGTVSVVVESGNTIYIGGNFSYVGPATGNGVPIDAGSGAALAAFPQVNGPITAAISDGVGGWYIGGNFTTVGGVVRNRLAHIRADYTVDPAWNPSANGGVYTLAVSGSTVYAGGDFTSIGGQSARAWPRLIFLPLVKWLSWATARSSPTATLPPPAATTPTSAALLWDRPSPAPSPSPTAARQI